MGWITQYQIDWLLLSLYFGGEINIGYLREIEYSLPAFILSDSIYSRLLRPRFYLIFSFVISMTLTFKTNSDAVTKGTTYPSPPQFARPGVVMVRHNDLKH